MQVSASKVRADFTRLLSQLSAGPIQITKHGKVVAVLMSPEDLTTSTETTTTSPDEALEAVTEAEPTQDTSKASEAPESPPNGSQEMTLEDKLDSAFSAATTSEQDERVVSDWEDEDEDEEADFERYLSSIRPEEGKFFDSLPL